MDNVELPSGSGGATVAADDVSSVYYQRVKLDIGADGAASGTAGVVGTPIFTRASDGSAAVSVATSGKQDTLITALQACQTALEIIDNIVSGSEAQVDVVTLPALPAGTNNIGDVDVLTVPVDPFGANADAAATAGSTGSIQAKLRLLTSQMDAVKTSVETLDNAIAGSEMQVDVITMPTVAVTQSGTWDEVGINDSGNSITVDNPQLSVVGTGTEAAAMRVTIATDSTGVLSVDDNGGSLTVDGTVAVTGVATSAKQDTAQTALDAIKTAAEILDNTVAGSEMQVDVITMPTVTVNSHAVTNAGTFVVQENGGALTALQIMDDWDNGASDGASVSGDVAHDAADAGEPVKIGGKAVSADPTAVATNDRVNALFDLVGKQITLPYAIPEYMVSGAITSAMTGTTSTILVAAPAAGLRNYITTIICSNAHATVGTDIVIQDGSGGTTLLTIPAAAVYGGAVITLPTPLRQPTTATAIYCANVTTGASTKVSAVGFKGA